MDGTETQDDLDRCRLHDALWPRHARYPAELMSLTGLSIARVAALTNHEWFWKQHGEIRIRYAGGVHLKGAKS